MQVLSKNQFGTLMLPDKSPSSLVPEKTNISHIITFMSQNAVTFEALSLSLSDLGTIPDIITLFVSVFQVIVKL